MEFKRQRTSGDRSPIVGGDLHEGWKIDDLLDAYVKQKTENNDLIGDLAWEKALRARWVKGSSAVCLVLLFLFISALLDSPPRPVVSKQTVPPGSQAAPAPLPASAANPSAAILPCAQGKWVTVLGSWHHQKGLAGDLFVKLREIQKRAEENGVELQINYTPRGEQQCDTLKTDYYVFWNGPHPDSKAAINVCHRLGWTTEADDDWCFARVIDPTYQGKKHIRPDEG